MEQGHVQEEDLNEDCEEGLDEEGGAEVGAEPVEYPAAVFVRGVYLFFEGLRIF